MRLRSRPLHGHANWVVILTLAALALGSLGFPAAALSSDRPARCSRPGSVRCSVGQQRSHRSASGAVQLELERLSGPLHDEITATSAGVCQRSTPAIVPAQPPLVSAPGATLRVAPVPVLGFISRAPSAVLGRAPPRV